MWQGKCKCSTHKVHALNRTSTRSIGLQSLLDEGDSLGNAGIRAVADVAETASSDSLSTTSIATQVRSDTAYEISGAAKDQSVLGIESRALSSSLAAQSHEGTDDTTASPAHGRVRITKCDSDLMVLA